MANKKVFSYRKKKKKRKIVLCIQVKTKLNVQDLP